MAKKNVSKKKEKTRKVEMFTIDFTDDNLKTETLIGEIPEDVAKTWLDRQEEALMKGMKRHEQWDETICYKSKNYCDCKEPDREVGFVYCHKCHKDVRDNDSTIITYTLTNEELCEKHPDLYKMIDGELYKKVEE